ncbi:MAG: 2-oxoisovalerate dehydrogenase, E1 component beta subunit [bacterium 42_11]|nr:MAG: 2-oxoisovalerate dehydrogenase, E1 component beta subunit [bacterium 42_11]
MMKLKEIIFIVEEDPEGGYNARALDYSIFTEADTLEALKENIKDAINCHFDKIDDRPDIIRLHIVREETFTYG